MSPRDKVISRVLKLRAIAASSEQGDAQAATLQAKRMIEKHKLTEDELSPPVEEEEPQPRARRAARRAPPTPGDNKSEELINVVNDLLGEFF